MYTLTTKKRRCESAYQNIGPGCFYINLPIGGLSGAIILLFFQTPESAKPADPSASLKTKILNMDPLGTLLVMSAIVCYLLAMQYGGQSRPWGSADVVGLLVGFVAIAGAFAAWEAFRGEGASIIPRLMRRRTVWVNCLYTFFFTGSFYTVVYYLPIYFQAIVGVSPTMSGVRNLPMILATSLSILASGAAISRAPVAPQIMVVATAVATVGTGLLYTFQLVTPAGKWIGYQVVGGIGYGFAFQIPIIAVQAGSELKDLPASTAIVLCKLLRNFPPQFSPLYRFTRHNFRTFKSPHPSAMRHR